MDKINYILDWVNSNGIITSICAILSVIISVYVYKNNRHRDIAKERLINTYEPLFNILSEHLYKYSNNKDFKSAMYQAEKIMYKYRCYSGNNLIFVYEQFKSRSNKKTYEKFCDVFLKNYNRLCRGISIPTIPLLHRVVNKWMSKSQFILFLILQVIEGLVIAVTVVFLMLIILSFFILIFQKTLL